MFSSFIGALLEADAHRPPPNGGQVPPPAKRLETPYRIAVDSFFREGPIGADPSSRRAGGGSLGGRPPPRRPCPGWSVLLEARDPDGLDGPASLPQRLPESPVPTPPRAERARRCRSRDRRGRTRRGGRPERRGRQRRRPPTGAPATGSGGGGGRPIPPANGSGQPGRSGGHHGAGSSKSRTRRAARPLVRNGGSVEDAVGQIVGHDRVALSRGTGDGVRGAAHPAGRRSGSGAESRGVKGGRSAPLPGRDVQHRVGWLMHTKKCASQPTAPPIRSEDRPMPRGGRGGCRPTPGAVDGMLAIPVVRVTVHHALGQDREPFPTVRHGPPSEVHRPPVTSHGIPFPKAGAGGLGAAGRRGEQCGMDPGALWIDGPHNPLLH